MTGRTVRFPVLVPARTMAIRVAGAAVNTLLKVGDWAAASTISQGRAINGEMNNGEADRTNIADMAVMVEISVDQATEGALLRKDQVQWEVDLAERWEDLEARVESMDHRGIMEGIRDMDTRVIAAIRVVTVAARVGMDRRATMAAVINNAIGISTMDRGGMNTADRGRKVVTAGRATIGKVTDLRVDSGALKAGKGNSSGVPEMTRDTTMLISSGTSLTAGKVMIKEAMADRVIATRVVMAALMARREDSAVKAMVLRVAIPATRVVSAVRVLRAVNGDMAGRPKTSDQKGDTDHREVMAHRVTMAVREDIIVPDNRAATLVSKTEIGKGREITQVDQTTAISNTVAMATTAIGHKEIPEVRWVPRIGPGKADQAATKAAVPICRHVVARDLSNGQIRKDFRVVQAASPEDLNMNQKANQKDGTSIKMNK